MMKHVKNSFKIMKEGYNNDRISWEYRTRALDLPVSQIVLKLQPK